VSDLPSPDIEPPPDPTQLKAGIMDGISSSHFSKPIEVSDVFRAPPSMPPWMVCIRSATSDEAKRIAYSVFYGKNTDNGKDGEYLKSRYSIYIDNCGSQTYHPFVDTEASSPSPSPSPMSGPKKHHKRDQ
jgi:hypothetical protein